MFVPPLGFRNAATVLAVAEDYSGAVQTLTAISIDDAATVMYSTATPDVAVGGSDGVLSLATPLAGNDKGGDGDGDGRQFDGVAYFDSAVGFAFGFVAAADALCRRQMTRRALLIRKLSVTGGDGGGATVFTIFNSENFSYGVDSTGVSYVIPSNTDISAGDLVSFTVSVSQPAVIGGRTATGVLSIFIYDDLSVASLPTLTVEIGRTGAIAGGVVMPAGGSGDYGFFGGQRRGDGGDGRGARFVDGGDDDDDAVGGGGGDGPGFDCAGGFGDGGVGGRGLSIGFGRWRLLRRGIMCWRPARADRFRPVLWSR